MTKYLSSTTLVEGIKSCDGPNQQRISLCKEMNNNYKNKKKERSTGDIEGRGRGIYCQIYRMHQLPASTMF